MLAPAACVPMTGGGYVMSALGATPAAIDVDLSVLPGINTASVMHCWVAPRAPKPFIPINTWYDRT